MPAAALSATSRQRLAAGSGEFVAGLSGGRQSSMIVNSETADLIRCFERPVTVVDAILLFCRRRQAEPEAVLEASWPSLERLVARRVLVDADSAPEGEPISFAAGDRPIEGLTLVRRIHHLEGGEVYLARLDGAPAVATAGGLTPPDRQRHVAMKVQWRQTGVGDLGAEAEALRRLGGVASPRLLATGAFPDGASWLLREWVDGVTAAAAGRSARLEDTAPGPRSLTLACRIARAYASVHEAGVLHGDVHPDNVLVDASDRAVLIDFALARGLGTPLSPRESLRPRAGVPFFIEPEQAATLLAGRKPLPSSPAGEQFAVGALLYEVITGLPYMDFRLDQEGLLRQITKAEPRPFTARGLAPWPELEAILRRALGRRPADRFPSLSALAGALEELAASGARSGRQAAAQRRGSRSHLSQAAREVRQAAGRTSSVPDQLGPALYDGAAGVAYAHLRLAVQRDEPSALAAAELWLSAAERRPPNSDPREVGTTSPFHTRSGAFAVRAMLAHALADRVARDAAVEGFLERVAPVPAAGELMTGKAGILLVSSLLLDLAPSAAAAVALRAHGNRLVEALAEDWASRPAISRHGGYLGMAHGWAGELYAALRWARSGGAPLTGAGLERLAQLSLLATPRGRGRAWPRRRATCTAGWCHGSAGHVYLWWSAALDEGVARSGLSQEVCRRLAEQAAWDAWEGPPGDGSLCCGLAGRSWALLHQARHSGAAIWRRRAHRLAERAADAPFPHDWGLFKGRLALAVLEADLDRSQSACLPFFEREGWPTPAVTVQKNGS